MGTRVPKPGFKQAKAAAKAALALVSAPVTSAAPSIDPEVSTRAPAPYDTTISTLPHVGPTPEVKTIGAHVGEPAVVVLAVQPAAALPSATARENPDKLTGDELRAHAHRRGISRSAAATMSDEKLRMELRYITYRQYEAA